MNPQDALEAIFEEIAKIYVKLCETIEVLLSISMGTELFNNDGNAVNQSISFDNLNTEANTDIQAILLTQISDFNAYITSLLQAKRALLNSNQQGFSDCRVLKVCAKLNTINGLWVGVQNVAGTPQEISQNLANAISEIKALFDNEQNNSLLLSISTDNPLLALDGSFLNQNITFDNNDTEANSNVEDSIISQVGDFVEFIAEYVGTTRLNLSGDQQNGTDCEVIKVCSKEITINAIWQSFQNQVAKPEEISQLLSKAILDIKLLFDTVEEEDNIIPFEVPIIWTDKGRLNIDPNSYPIILDNPNNDNEISDKQTEINDVFGEFLKAINIALGNTSDPIN